MNNHSEDPADRHSISSGVLDLFVAQHVAQLDGQDLHFTRMQFDLLLILARAHPAIVETSTLYDHLYSDDTNTYIKQVSDHVSKLRNKFQAVTRHPLIVNRYQIGYQLILPTGLRLKIYESKDNLYRST